MSGVRKAVEFLFTRVLRSRIGVALGLAVVVLGIVGAARLYAGPTDPVVRARPPAPIATVDPEAGDDGVIDAESTPTPSTSPGAAAPGTVAKAFATAWLLHRGVPAEQWHAALAPHSTKALSEKLSGVDPAGVPADEMTGEPVVDPRTPTLVEVTVPMNAGRLRLQLVAPDGRWLVDTVDWERS
ncbi:hypothetical protein ACFOX0_00255 [Micromonospora zhanjiangensis]|uniref:DUF4878 domain-containing protein n=1 Tax=Micromonospora zhanjiangensis TaxID=1522057 RepID=A0ABV8KEF1_9ACTN